MDKISIEKKTTTYDPALEIKTTVTKYILRYESESLSIPVAVVQLTHTKTKDLPSICSYHVYPVLKKILPHADEKVIDDAKSSSDDSDTAYVIRSMDIISESNIAGENFIEGLRKELKKHYKADVDIRINSAEKPAADSWLATSSPSEKECIGIIRDKMFSSTVSVERYEYPDVDNGGIEELYRCTFFWDNREYPSIIYKYRFGVYNFTRILISVRVEIIERGRDLPKEVLVFDGDNIRNLYNAKSNIEDWPGTFRLKAVKLEFPREESRITVDVIEY